MTVTAKFATAVVPAAGKAERFGGGKLLAPLAGEPLLAHTLRSLIDGGVGAIVLVTAPGASFADVSLAADSRVRPAENPDPSRGMFSSIQAGIACAEAGGPILVLPADMPFVAASTVGAVLAAARQHDDRLIVPVHAGRRGHPIAIPGRVRDALLRADPRGSLRDALASLTLETMTVSVDDSGILKDVDTRQDLT